ncbi:ABC transporter permease subunit [Alteromonas sp. a30]|uniref:ABC transporter permease subunit n=1 Tax=Alteromonas sp. a30 TaxID=2730917 RepID=UPI002280DD64|nr:ABC transporter permease subunit [Alteromonas sp. a30]MCY7297010.1 ABC transporter permease [Alteromonas sp. a30]
MWLVFQKELREAIRDKRSILFMFLFPLVLFPLLFGGVALFAAKAVQDAESKVLKYSILNHEHHPQIVADFAADKHYRFIAASPHNFKQRIQSGELDFVLLLPDTLMKNPLEVGQSRIKLFLNDASLNKVFNRVREKTKVYSEQMQAQMLASLGVSQDKKDALMRPIYIEKVNLANDREDLGEKIGGFIPYFIFVLLLQGVVYLAADLGAGEKERGTLETLLLAPIPRQDIVLGKFFAIMVAGLTSALVTVVSFVGWGIGIGQGLAISVISEFFSQIGLLDMLLMFLMLIPVVTIFASLTLSLSIFAKSYKEAQTYMGYLMLLAFVPIVLAMLPGVSLQGGWAWVPLTNVALAIKELVKGTMNYSAFVAIFLSTALIGLGALYFCVRWFNKEKVLFR